MSKILKVVLITQNSLELNVAFASLSGIGGNDTLASLMSDVPHNSIIVMEDIDHLFESVTSTTKAATSTLTMSGLLNVLDGIQGQEGASKSKLYKTVKKKYFNIFFFFSDFYDL